MKLKELEERVFSLDNDQDFEALGIEIFKHQAREVPVYREFVRLLRVNPNQVKSLQEIPFLPIEFFKSQKVFWPNDQVPEVIFTSSGTTGMQTSQHGVFKKELYEKSYNLAFQQFYGNPQDLVILALLPNYQERTGSSLIFMVDDLLKQSKQPESGYFLYNHEELAQTLLKLKDSGKKVLLIGVSFALLDFVEKHPLNFPELIVMETGGMKGKRKELIREELHEILKKGFGVASIHSEYGMTELLSQAYSSGQGIFSTPPWMKIFIRDIHDHFSQLPIGKTGGINVIDLANLYSCSFIATQDLGKLKSEGDGKTSTFEILGRFDHSDIRGCNLMVNL